MDNTEMNRRRRSPEERAAAIDAQIADLEASLQSIEEKKNTALETFDNKIASVKAKIENLNAKKTEILTPKPRKPRLTEKQRFEALMKKAKKAGLKYSDIEARLNLDNSEPEETEGEGSEE